MIPTKLTSCGMMLTRWGYERDGACGNVEEITVKGATGR